MPYFHDRTNKKFLEVPDEELARFADDVVAQGIEVEPADVFQMQPKTGGDPRMFVVAKSKQKSWLTQMSDVGLGHAEYAPDPNNPDNPWLIEKGRGKEGSETYRPDVRSSGKDLSVFRVSDLDRWDKDTRQGYVQQQLEAQLEQSQPRGIWGDLAEGAKGAAQDVFTGYMKDQPVHVPADAPLAPPEMSRAGIMDAIGSAMVPTAKSVGSGTLGMISGAARVPELMTASIYDQLAIPANMIEKFTGLQTGTNYEEIRNSPWNVFKYVDDGADALKEVSKKLSQAQNFEGGIVEKFGQGDIAGGFEHLWYAAAETAPQLGAAAVATMAGQPAAGLALLSASAAGQKFDEIRDDENLSAFKKYSNSVISGAIEGIAERLGTFAQMAKVGKSKPVRDQALKGIKAAISKVRGNKAVRTATPALSEAFEEGSVQVANNISDIAFGVRDEAGNLPGVWDGVPDAFLLGGVMGGGISIADVVMGGGKDPDVSVQREGTIAEPAPVEAPPKIVRDIGRGATVEADPATGEQTINIDPESAPASSIPDTPPTPPGTVVGQPTLPTQPQEADIDLPQGPLGRQEAQEQPQGAIKEPPLPFVAPERKYSRDNVKEAFGLTDDQADAVDVLVKSMGINTEQVQVAKGGKPGEGALEQAVKAKSPRVRRTISQLVSDAKSMSEWRDWYDRHEAVVSEMFGEDAVLFQEILAATSQAASVKANVGLALKAYDQLKSGKPFEGYLGGVIANLNRIRENQEIQGPKIGEYGKAGRGDSEGIAVDRHIARLMFGVDVPNAGQRRQAQKRIRQVAEELGWKPREVQAALWAFNQTLEGTDPTQVQSYDTILKEKADTIEQLRSSFGDTEGESAGVQERGDIASEVKGTLEQREDGGEVLGSMEVKKDGTRIVRGFEGSKVHTALHEFAHVARNQLLNRDVAPENRVGITDEDIAIAEEWAGAKDGNWTKDAEEKFARGFEKYMRTGIAPNERLKPLFWKLGQWMRELYSSVKGTPIDVRISTQMQGVFDKLVTRQDLEPTQAQTTTQQAQAATSSTDPQGLESAPQSTEQIVAEKLGLEAITPGKTVLDVTIGEKGKVLNRPRKATVLQVVDENTVRVETVNSKRKTIVRDIPVARLSLPARVRGKKARDAKFAGLSKAERRQVRAQEKELKQAIEFSPYFFTDEVMNEIDMQQDPIKKGATKEKHINAAISEIFEELGIPDDADTKDPVIRASIMLDAKQVIAQKEDAAGMGDGPLTRIANIKDSMEGQLNEPDIAENDLIYKNGNWFLAKANVDTASDVFVILEDGETIELGESEVTNAQGRLSQGDVGYDEAMAEYHEQLVAEGKTDLSLEEWRASTGVDQAAVVEQETAPVEPEPAQEPAPEPVAEPSPAEPSTGVPEAPEATPSPEPIPEAPPIPPKAVIPPDSAKQPPSPGSDQLYFAAQNSVTKADRETMGLDEIGAPARKEFAKHEEQAVAEGIPDRALDIANEVNAVPRQLEAVEIAGLVHRGMDLKKQHRQIGLQRENVTDTAEDSALIGQQKSIEQEFDAITAALVASGTKQAQAFAIRRMHLNEGYDVVSIVNRAKTVAKRAGVEFTQADRVQLEDMASKIKNQQEAMELLQWQVDALLAEKVMRKGKAREYASMSKPQRGELIADRAKTISELRKQGCS